MSFDSHPVRHARSSFVRSKSATRTERIPARNKGSFCSAQRLVFVVLFENHIILAMATDPQPSQFLLLLRQPQAGPGPTPEELGRIMQRFSQWMSGLEAKGILVANNGLETTGKVLRQPRGASVTDGPYPETKEIVGGYILIKAESLTHAVEIARDCPGLDYSLAVEVRPVRPRPRA